MLIIFEKLHSVSYLFHPIPLLFWGFFFVFLKKIWIEFFGKQEWNKEVWVKDGVPASKIFVVGEGVDTAQRFNPASISKLEARERVVPRVVRDNYLFLSVFKFEKRKGWEELVTAFVEEFGCEEPVTLLLRTGQYFGFLSFL